MEGFILNLIGLRKEEKAFETRVAVIPGHVKLLGEKHGISFVVEPSNQRAFDAKEYIQVGAEISPLKRSNVPIVLGIKEMPNDFFEPDKVYIFFSHTIKGQKQNMSMLQRLLDTGATLIDYEKVIDDKGRRLIYFGNWAGMAGISDTLRSLGERLDYEDIKPNPFAGMRSTLECKDLSELKEEFRKLAERIKTQGLPPQLTPFVIGFAGYGNVSCGAQKIFDILPHEEITPEQLNSLPPKDDLLYKCVFKEEHMVEPIDPNASFDLQDYYKHGAEKYLGVFHKYVHSLTVLMNCIYWTKKSPRLITKDFIRKHWHEESRKLRIIGDISCDIGGAIEFTLQCTHADRPSFTYIVDEDKALLGVEGDGPVIMAVDNLPCELPREASTSFSETLLDFIPALAGADFSVPFEELSLPRELLDAVIVYRGTLTKNYAYLEQYLK